MSVRQTEMHVTNVRLPQGADHELVRHYVDADSGLEAVVAIHSTARGPAFGGCRYWTYESSQPALTDVLRLSEGMTLKNALADLPFGGGKAVILRNARQTDRKRVFQLFGEIVDSLDGRYITAEDVGTTTGDMTQVLRATNHVSGLPRGRSFGGDPSPKTALGVFVSIQKGVHRILDRSTLEGTTVAVQGLGSVGWELCRLLAGAGCKLIVADIDERRVADAVKLFDARRVAAADILRARADVLAPCALGAVLDARSVEMVESRIVAGAANNQLATIEDGDRLQARGVFYLPDFLVNAGGIISVAREHLGQATEEAVDAEVVLIANRVDELIDRVRHGDVPPARVAIDWARTKVRKP